MCALGTFKGLGSRHHEFFFRRWLKHSQRLVGSHSSAMSQGAKKFLDLTTEQWAWDASMLRHSYHRCQRRWFAEPKEGERLSRIRIGYMASVPPSPDSRVKLPHRRRVELAQSLRTRRFVEELDAAGEDRRRAVRFCHLRGEAHVLGE